MKLLLLLQLLIAIFSSSAYTVGNVAVKKNTFTTPYMSTTTAPQKEKTKTGTRVGSRRPVKFGRSVNKGGPLEYLQDDSSLLRKKEDPFHILLLGTTFQKPRMTKNYVSSSLVFVLDMPETEADEHAEFAEEQGISCLGTWTREECLLLGAKLQNRDLECRVVPFCEGGSRPWQAKKADANNEDGKSFSGGFD